MDNTMVVIIGDKIAFGVPDEVRVHIWIKNYRLAFQMEKGQSFSNPVFRKIL